MCVYGALRRGLLRSVSLYFWAYRTVFMETFQAVCMGWEQTYPLTCTYPVCVFSPWQQLPTSGLSRVVWGHQKARLLHQCGCDESQSQTPLSLWEVGQDATWNMEVWQWFIVLNEMLNITNVGLLFYFLGIEKHQPFNGCLHQQMLTLMLKYVDVENQYNVTIALSV